MYLAMIGMALIAVPRGVFRFVTWIIMGGAAWFLAAVETVWADATASFSNGIITAEINNDDQGVDTIQISLSGGNVYVNDNVHSPSLMAAVGNVTGIQINGGDDSVGDWLDCSIVSSANGFSTSTEVDIFGNGGDDTILGSHLADEIEGGGGDDSILGLGDDDFIKGGSGADYISGGDGDDILSHNTGTSEFADGSADTLIGGETGEIFGDTGYFNVTNDGDTDSEIENRNFD